MKKHWYESHFFKAFWISSFVILFYYLLLAPFQFFQVRVLRSQDLIAKWVYSQKSAAVMADSVVLVTIDNEDFEKVRKWPWPRALFGEFLEKLNRYEPKVVFFDIIFHGESPSGKEDDAPFVRAIAEKGNVVLASFFDKDWNYQTPYEKFTDVAFDVGFVNKPRDVDLVVRQFRALVFSDENEVVDLGAEIKIVCKYLDIPLNEMYLQPDAKSPTEIELRQPDGNGIHIPIDSLGKAPIDFTVAHKNVTIVPFWKVLQHDLPKELFQNKIVLISITSEAFHDQFHTPIGEDQPGVVIGANVIQMLLKNQFLKDPSKMILRAIVFVLVFFVCFLTLRCLLWVALSGTIFFVLGVFVASYFLRTLLIEVDLFSPLFLMISVFSGTTLHNYFRLLIRNSKLRQLAITDGLTGMYIYRYLVLRLKNELERAQRYSLELSFVIADIDHFKRFNDTYGHDVGNMVLKNFAEIIKKNSRKTDFAARYGGEEFCLLLPHTDQAHAVQLADKLREAVASFQFPSPQGPLQVRASFGVSSFKADQINSVKKLFTSADAALYRAKETGRNRVCGFDPTLDKFPDEEGDIDSDDFSVPLD